ncbi:MAG: ankyrin repeat domain-containing protein [Turneriella sp.]|nr:ankyrin repeat domain-containing protein [Turneriella sp.]
MRRWQCILPIVFLLWQCRTTQKVEETGPNADLLRAAAAGDAEAAERAILAGADALVTDQKGRTPLHLAVLSGSAATVKLLLQPKSKLSERRARREGVAILNFINRTGSANYAWVGASLPDAIQGVMAENFEFKRLPEKQTQQIADKTIGRKTELTPELLAELGKRTQAMVIIIGDYELQVDKKQVNIRTLVFTPADGKILTQITVPGYLDARLFESLSAVGSQIGENLRQYTAPDFAIRLKNSEQLLISDINARDRSGLTPLYHAAIQKNSELINILIKAGADFRTDLIEAINFGDDAVAAELIQHAPEIDFRIAGARTPLIQAAYKGRPLAVAALLARKANYALTDVAGFTALMYAAQEGHRQIVADLLQAGANPNAKTWDNFSALEAARRKNRTEIVEMLAKAGAK